MNGMRYQPQGLLRLAAGPVRKPVAAFVASAAGLRITGDGKHDRQAFPTGSGLTTVGGPNGYASRPRSGVTTNTYRLNAVANQFDTVWEKPQTQVTVLLVFRRFGSPAGTSPIFSNQCPNNNPFVGWGLFDLPTGFARFEVATRTTGDPNSLPATIQLPNNELVVLIGRYDGAEMTLWQNGEKVGAQAATGNLVYPNVFDRGPSVGNFYNFTGSARSAQMEIYGGAVWDSAASDYEISALSKIPWQVFAASEDDDYFAQEALSYVLAVQPATMSITAGQVGMRAARQLRAEPASLAIAPGSVGMRASRKLAVAPAALTLATSNVAMLASRRLGVLPATMAIAGGQVAGRVSRRLSVAPAAMVMTGSQVSMLYAPKPEPGSYTLPVSAAAMTLTGGNVGMRVARRLRVTPASLALAGGAVRALIGRRLMVSPAGLLLAGGAVTLRFSAKGEPFDITKIHPSRIVIFEGSGSRVTPFEGSGSRVTPFDSTGTRKVRFE
jgi:hypothetical protein